MALVNECPSCGVVYGGKSCPKCSATVVAPDPDVKPGSSLGGYEIDALLGRGGMGQVYRARQAALDRPVALKVLIPQHAHDPEFQTRFEREAKALAKLSHPNLIPVFDYGKQDDRYWFAMELVEGTDLRRRMEEGPLPPQEAIGIVAQICDALAYLHKQGIVHRDIKPENILIDASGRARIADFGLARVTEAGAPRLTVSDARMGTFRYASPEQMEASASVDARSDLYSLGVLFYELLTGEVPVGRFDPPSRKCTSPPSLDAAILQALEKDPARRPKSAEDFRSMILGRPSRFNPLWFGVAGAALLLGSTVVLFLLYARTPKPKPQEKQRREIPLVLLGPAEWPEQKDPSPPGAWRLDENPYHATTPAEIKKFKRWFEDWKLPDFGEVKEGYLLLLASTAYFAARCGGAADLEAALRKRWKAQESWVYREGDLVVYAWIKLEGAPPAALTPLVQALDRKLRR